MKRNEQISRGSILTVVMQAKEKSGTMARKHLKELSDRLTDSARLLVNGILPKKKSRKNVPESGK